MQTKLLINGKLTPGDGEVEEVLNPATGKVLARLGEASREQVNAAVTAAELTKAKTRYRYETLASVDDATAMAGWFGGTALYYPPPGLSQRLAQMDAVTIEDVRATAAEVLRPERLALAAVGALSRARLGELRDVVQHWRA